MPSLSPRPFLFPNAMSVLLVVLVAVAYMAAMNDLDWTWQVRTGKQILDMQTLRTPDLFSYTIHGTLVHDFEWIYEVVLYLVWSVLGMGGLKLLKMIVIAVPLMILGLRLRSEGVRWHGIAIALVVAVGIVSPAWNLRPLMMTTIGLLLLSWWLHDHCNGKGQVGWSLPILMLLWSNMHPGIITGQGTLAGAIAWEWINRWIKFNAPLDNGRLWRLTIFGGLGLAATFLSPDPVDRLLYPFQPNLAHPIQRQFTEMKPLYRFIGDLPSVVLLAYGLAALVVMTILLRPRKYRAWELALLGGLALLANFAVRVLSDWAFIMLSLGVPHLRDLFVAAVKNGWHRRWVRRLLKVDSFFRRVLDSKLLRFQPLWPALAALVFLVVSLIPPLGNSIPHQNSLQWPVAALDYAVEHQLHGRYFGIPDYGAYIGWRLKENGLVYTDTRGFFFPPQLLEDSIYLPRVVPEWRERMTRVLDEYETDYFLLDVDNKFSGDQTALWFKLAPYIDKPLLFKRDKDDAEEPYKWVILSAQQVRAALAKLDQATPSEGD